MFLVGLFVSEEITGVRRFHEGTLQACLAVKMSHFHYKIITPGDFAVSVVLPKVSLSNPFPLSIDLVSRCFEPSPPQRVTLGLLSIE